jgi:hypothetical protein
VYRTGVSPVFEFASIFVLGVEQVTWALPERKLRLLPFDAEIYAGVLKETNEAYD